MPAMHTDVRQFMYNSLNSMLERMADLIPFEMTHQECIELLAPADHIEILTSAAKYADVQSSEAWMDVIIPATVDGEVSFRMHLQMRTHGEKQPPLRPRTPEWQPGKAGHKVIEYVDARLKLGRRFGLAHWVLTEMCERCDQGQQVRYLWPACMHLLKHATSDTRPGVWAEKHQQFKPCKNVPAISPQLKRAIQDSAALITSCALMGEDVPERVKGEVDIGVWTVRGFDFDGVLVQRH